MTFLPDPRGGALAAVFALHALLLAGCCSITDIKQEALPDGVVGQPYSAHLEHNCEGKLTEHVISWRVIGSLPPGIRFSSSEFSGTPTRAGTFSFTVEVGSTSLYNPSVFVAKEYTLSVTDGRGVRRSLELP